MKNKKVKMSKKQEKRLAELYTRIEEEVEFVDVKQYSHNIISINLRIISEEFGYNKANEAIDKLGLNSLGWRHEEEPKTIKIRSSKMNNRNHKNWTATDRTKLTRMYRSGRLSVRQIASRLGRTYFATIKQAERMGIRSIRISRSLRKRNTIHIHNAIH